MTLSIIIPTYNNNVKLSRLLNSIPMEPEIDIIVVDDHGTESAINLSFQYPQVSFYYNENGKGAGGARNTGLEYAVGKYVLFADSDDIFIDDWFDIVQSHMISGSEDVVFFPPSSFFEGELNKIGTRHLRYKKHVDLFLDEYNEDIRYYFYVPWSKLIKRNLIIRHGIKFEEIKASNDLNFSLKVGLFADTIVALDKTIYKVEQGVSSMTKIHSIENLTCRLDALFRYNVILHNHNLTNKKLMMAPWLFKLFKKSFYMGGIYLFRGIMNRTPIIIDHRFKK